jgi:transcription antitermination protein NusB
MGARRLGRERALQALYQLEQDPKLDATQALEASWSASDDGGGVRPDEVEARQFGLELTQGVQLHREEIDALLEHHSLNWRLERMQRIDRNVLRIGIYELLHRPEIPKKVTINEAVELGKGFGTEDSSAFINGLLDRIAAELKKP